MKKIFFLALMSVVCMFANADEISSDDYSLYLEDATAQVGSSVDVYVKIKYVNQVGAAQFKLKLPEGVTVEGFKGYDGTSATEAGDADSYYVLGGCQGLETVGVFTLSVPSDMNVGDYEMTITDFKMADFDAPATKYVGENVVSTLTVQKTAVIEELPEGYVLAAKPFVAYEGENNIEIMYKSPEIIKDLSFDLTLPKGMFLYNGDYDSTVPQIVSSVVTAPATGITISPVDEQTVNVKIIGNKLKKTGLIASDDVVNAFTLTAYVFSEEEEMGPDYAYEPNSLQTIKISNIKMGNLDGSKNFSGEYLGSVIYGTPKADEAILYGYYNGNVPSEISDGLKNVAFADVTAATLEENAKFQDVIVNEKGGNSYYTRTSANYGTTVLPYTLTANEALQLYAVKEMNASSITIEEVAEVTANETCIFKGTINVEGDTPTLGVPSEKSLGTTTFKGTYEATSVAAGDGYYISSDGKFYGDGATVRPFRGYFDGKVSDVKSFSVFVNTANGLVDITNQLSDEAIYSLQGIRTQTAKKGVNIVGGKKVYIK